jgi:hypothetical protein
MCTQRFVFRYRIRKGRSYCLSLLVSASQEGLCSRGSQSVQVGRLVTQVQELHINIAGRKGLEHSKCQMVMIFKPGSRSTKFLEFHSWDFIGWACRYIDPVYEGGKIGTC